jgi:2-keto-4-pentenoate hydratase/2-oxohepta-3-ene-1,7-dioic acid hydratase in catechol pathway
MSGIQLLNSDKIIPVSKIICVGSNYSDHIQEMKSSFEKPDPAEPVLFLKPPSAIIHNGGIVMKPAYSAEMHHEVECVIVIGKAGKRISPDNVKEHILGYTVGLDMTLRDLQKKAKQRGEPWAVAKGFDTSAVVGDIVLSEEIDNPDNLIISLWVNDQLKQHGNTSNMINKIQAIVAMVSKYFYLERGDLIFTGTPSGVGPVHKGNRIRASLDQYVTIEVTVDEE